MTAATETRLEHSWAWCPVCERERRTLGSWMAEHRRYDYDSGEMVPCEGTGQSPWQEDS